MKFKELRECLDAMHRQAEKGGYAHNLDEARLEFVFRTYDGIIEEYVLEDRPIDEVHYLFTEDFDVREISGTDAFYYGGDGKPKPVLFLAMDGLEIENCPKEEGVEG